MRVPLQSWSWLLAILLLGLGGLQYRWIGELSEADRDRLERARVSESNAFLAQIDREVTRLFTHFLPRRLGRGREERVEPAPPELVMRKLVTSWRGQAQHHQLLGRVFRIEDAFTPDAQVSLYSDGQLENTALPDGLEMLAEARRRRGRGLGPVLPPGFVIVPQSRPRPSRGTLRPPDTVLALELDRSYLTEVLFPDAAERLELVDFEVGVQGVSGDWIFSTADGDSFEQNDLFGSLPHLRRVPEGLAEEPQSRRGQPRPGGEARGPWKVYVRHADGDIDRVVGAARRRNLLLSLGTLGVLAASMVLVTSAAARAQRTAEQQVTFVASLTHELHTPLAAISAAASNLSDGIVDEKDRVRDYGKLIQREGRRLESLVSQSLQLAGIRSGAPPRLQRMSVDRWIDESIEGCEWLAEELDVTFAKELSTPSAEFSGDSDALVQALRNLLTNALKHSPPGGSVLVRSNVDGGRLTVEVLDEGPGFPTSGRNELLEPFARAEGDATSGTGLGLHVAQQIVEHHRGSIELLDRDDGNSGARVRIRLPIAESAS